MKRRRCLAVAALCVLLAAAAPAEAAPGKLPPQLKARLAGCAACHGRHGVSRIPAFPTLAGQPTSYLVHALKAYRDRTRENAIMDAQAQGLSDVEIRALAAYYHRQNGPLVRRVP